MPRQHGRRRSAASSARIAARRFAARIRLRCGCSVTREAALGQRPVEFDPQLARLRAGVSRSDRSSTLALVVGRVELAELSARSTGSTAATPASSAGEDQAGGDDPLRAFQRRRCCSAGTACQRQMAELPKRRHIELRPARARRLVRPPARLRRASSCRSRKSAGRWPSSDWLTRSRQRLIQLQLVDRSKR